MNIKRYTPHISSTLALAVPVMLSQLGHVMMGVVDSLMVGHVGAVPLAAASLANVAFNVILLFGIGVSYAMTPLVAAAHGEANDQKISDVLKHGLVINIVNAGVLVAMVMAAKNILYHISQPAEVVAEAIPYLGIITFSIIPTLVFQTFRQFTEGLSQTRVAMIAVIGSNLIHVPLNYALIFGHWGFPELGLQGAGWATLFSRVVMALGIGLYVYFAPRFSQFRKGFSVGHYSQTLVKKMLSIGLPAGTQFIFEAAAFDLSAVMMGWLGAKTLAAHQIAINLATISYMTTSGLAAAATIRVSNELGKKDFKTLRTVAFTLIFLATAVMFLWGILFIGGRNILPTLYINDPEVISTAASLLIIAGFFQLSDGIQVVAIGALRGLHDVKVPSVFIFIAYWVIGLPLGYTLAFIFHWGAIGIWIGLLIGLTLTATAMVIRFYKLSHNPFPPG
ncbi:MAG: MATE family efflux transporter [Bacteroidetes bacterium]|nr:MATE family efflux transporter [Bacteroidota bacterium]MBS1540260.1 MATE family efflux transporter [Bacteroidota bacterium]